MMATFCQSVSRDWSLATTRHSKWWASSIARNEWPGVNSCLESMKVFVLIYHCIQFMIVTIGILETITFRPIVMMIENSGFWSFRHLIAYHYSANHPGARQISGFGLWRKVYHKHSVANHSASSGSFDDLPLFPRRNRTSCSKLEVVKFLHVCLLVCSRSCSTKLSKLSSPELFQYFLQPVEEMQVFHLACGYVRGLDNAVDTRRAECYP
jgi:hypothetical protein